MIVYSNTAPVHPAHATGTFATRATPTAAPAPTSATNAPIHLDLGGALAAFGLIFAVYQLRREPWDVVLQIRRRWQSCLFWYFGVAGLSLSLLAVILSDFVVPTRLIPFYIPIALQVLAYLCFVLSAAGALFLFNARAQAIQQKHCKAFSTGRWSGRCRAQTSGM